MAGYSPPEKHKCHLVSKGGFYRCSRCGGIWLPGGARGYRGH